MQRQDGAFGPLKVEDIASILENYDDFYPDSEEEDCVTQDEVRSDVEGEMVDYIESTIQSDIMEIIQSPSQ
ncbi:unnamed protein product [Parnassius apollo]|uniref:(apollo) hypothetical protein n=1 Tax=Parnassius apollo TaxID=110799 RepID=A0A8S3X3W7_PARAO|nr:unnamed protein product [Parnassius apollo]